MKYGILTLAVVCALLAPAGAQQPNVADVPITKVVLFSSGVGYFEHAGQVDDDAVVQLNFRAGQINDVLKSMLVMDLSGKGTVTGVNYPSRDPLLRTLKSFAVDLSGDLALWKLLAQLRGAEIVVEVPDKIAGRILSIEHQQRQIAAGGKTTTFSEAVLNLVTDNGIRSMPMSSVHNVHLTDPKLSEELNKALDALLAARDMRRKPVDIRFSGQGQRAVRIGYVAEVPVWKVSYRLILGDDSSHLQGWAIVENTSDADWTNVRLSLVSGQPISFIEDLYTPLYLPRPVYSPRSIASLTPQTYDEGIEPPERPEPKELEELPTLGRRPIVGEGSSGFISEPESTIVSTVEALADVDEVGALFRFAIQQPVTLARRQSAMLPIVSEAFVAEKVSVWRTHALYESDSQFVFHGAYLRNKTGKKLPAGSLTVVNEGVYAGDSWTDNLLPDDRQLITYAVDLELKCKTELEGLGQKLAAVTIRDGALIQEGTSEEQAEITFTNTDDDDRQIIVEIQVNPHIEKLVEPVEFEERTPDAYRLRVAVPAGQTKTLLTRIQQDWGSHTDLVSGDLAAIAEVAKKELITDDVREVLNEVVAARRKHDALTKKLKQLQAELKGIPNDQERLRRNLQAVGADSAVGRRYLSKLDKQEDRIESLDKEIAQTRKAIEISKTQIGEYVKKLSIPPSDEKMSE